MLSIIKLTVNGHRQEIAVDQRWNLAEALRRCLGLTSVKKGCEVGECGACTVLVDGKAIDSCLYLAIWAAGKSVVTVEGLKKRRQRPASRPAGLHRRMRRTMRLLHPGPDYVRRGDRRRG